MNLRSDLPNLSVLWIAMAAIFLASTTATADVTFTAVGTILTGANAGSNDTGSAGSGDQVQVDIFMTNDSAEITGAAFNAGLEVDGEDQAFNTGPDGLNFDGGQTAQSWFNTGVNKTGVPTGGVVNGDGQPGGFDAYYTSVALPNLLDNSNITLNNHIRFFSAFNISATGVGDSDLGIKTGAQYFGSLGTVGIDLTGNGAAHARLLFTVVGAGGLVNIGMNSPDDSVTDPGAPGSVGTIVPAFIQVPEPAGVGLALAAMGSAFAVVGLRRRTS